MSDFLAFARSLGLIIRNFQPDGRIHSVPTEDKPRKRNGRYRYADGWGWAQNWATSAQAHVFRGDVGNAEPRRYQPTAEDGRAREAASSRATEIVQRCKLAEHSYLIGKGFSGEKTLVDVDGRMVVPMRDHANYRQINSVQWIDELGAKKFLTGGRAKGSVLRIGTGPELWLVEGFATGMSVKRALKTMFRPATVVVCFSAGNLAWLAAQIGGLIVADNDASGTGERVARESGRQWVMPDEVGMDANDYERAYGTRELATLLRTLV